MKSIYSYFSPLVALLIVPCLVWGQVVIPGTGGATPAIVAGQRTSVIPSLCTGTDKVTGIAVGGFVQCNTDVTGTTSPLTTKGDLWGFSTVDGRLGVGSNDQCVVADSTAPFGIKWGSCGSQHQIDGVNLTSNDPINFLDTTEFDWTNPAAGNLSLAIKAASIDLTTKVTGTLPVGNGGTGAGAFTLGSVVFAGASGVYTQDNANFFWDDSSNRLGVGTAFPSQTVELRSSSPTMRIRDTGNVATATTAFIEFGGRGLGQ